ncbi:MAG: helix-turn-helix domain-containing protein [Spirochaetes bacterium]|uniref:Helix-turn-helix domain-containing protein n=1 Tax=Candidatus Ornithospirochaeta stercoripullorum TaxID=2840899 RepID=A0A9D9DZN8_9SPIO|nr:helix-turn-helix domain-containing protein [Candidatus Ornithospirochaeta stercoripullorum]
MQKAYRYRLNPTDDEMQMMTRIIGCCHFVWNRLLEYCSKSYKRRGESHTAFHCAYPQAGFPMALRCACPDAAVRIGKSLLCFQCILQGECEVPQVQDKALLEEELQDPAEGKGGC